MLASPTRAPPGCAAANASRGRSGQFDPELVELFVARQEWQSDTQGGAAFRR